MQDRALWKRLLSHRFDASDGSVPFSRKLAKEEGWSQSFANKAIEEYRKFLYLTQVGKGQMSPSVAVDRVWHMHLTFTRDYWDRLCAEVLNTPLHHQPSKGTEENDRFADQYLRTRLLYAQEFGRKPPTDIWPDLGVAGGGGQRAFAVILISAILVLGGFVVWPQSEGASIFLLVTGAVGLIWGFGMAAPHYGRKNKSGCGGGCGGGADCGGGGCGGD